MSKREPSTLGAIAVPSGLALIDGVMTVAAVAGPAGLLVAGGAVAGCGAAAAAAKRRKQKQAISKTMSGSAKRAMSPGKLPKGGKTKPAGGKTAKGSAAKAAGRKSALGKMASAGKSGAKKAAAAKTGKGTGKPGALFGTGKTAGKKSAKGGKPGFGVSGRGLSRASKGSGRAGARTAPKVGRAKKTAAAVRKGTKRAAKSRLFGKTLMAVAATGRFWKDRKPAPKPVQDAFDKRMRKLAANPAKPKFKEPIQVELPSPAPPVPLPSRTKPAPTTEKGSPVSHPFASALEAVDAAFNSFDPENARKVEGYYAGIAELTAAFSRGLQIGGMRITEDFPIDPNAGEYVSGLSQHMAALQEHIEEATASFKNHHADQLERINSGDSRQVKWDYAANQE